MKKKEKLEEILHDIAESNGLDVVETTSQRNGYPSEIKKAIVGFMDWAQLREVVQKYEIVPLYSLELHKRDGWDLWYRGSRTSVPMEFRVDKWGDNYYSLNGDWKDERVFMKNHVMEIFEGFRENTDNLTFDNIRNFFDNFSEIWNEVQLIGDLDAEVVVRTDNDGVHRYVETMRTHPMGINHDGRSVQIALMIDEEKIDDIFRDFEE